MEPRAAVGIYDSGNDHYTLYTTSQNPHVARLVISAFYNCAGKQAARHRARCRRRLRLEDLHLCRGEIVCVWASKRIRRRR
jgi:carbon-monoxide dehydrogenase large subunit